jgi:hypothetical protein
MTASDDMRRPRTASRKHELPLVRSPGDHAPPRFPLEPPFVDCGMPGKESILFSFVRSPPEAFLPPRPRFSAAIARRGCQGWPRFSGHRRLGLGSVEHDGMLEFRGSLACATPRKRAKAAEGTSASPWWARATAVSQHAIDRFQTRCLPAVTTPSPFFSEDPRRYALNCTVHPSRSK